MTYEPPPEFADVLQRVRAYYAQPGQNGAGFGIDYPRRDLARETPGAYEPSGVLSQRYASQVLRAVRTLVAEGTLVKTGEGRDAQYWTPEARVKALADGEHAAAELAAEQGSWRQVKTRLQHHGFTDISKSATAVVLGLEAWEGLLGRLDRAISASGQAEGTGGRS